MNINHKYLKHQRQSNRRPEPMVGEKSCESTPLIRSGSEDRSRSARLLDRRIAECNVMERHDRSLFHDFRRRRYIRLGRGRHLSFGRCSLGTGLVPARLWHGHNFVAGNIIRPLVLSGRVKMNTLLIFFSLLWSTGFRDSRAFHRPCNSGRHNGPGEDTRFATGRIGLSRQRQLTTFKDDSAAVTVQGNAFGFAQSIAAGSINSHPISQSRPSMCTQSLNLEDQGAVRC